MSDHSSKQITKPTPRPLNTPDDLQTAIDEYFDKISSTIHKLGKKIKSGSGEKGSFDSEEYTEAAAVPTLPGLLLHLGLLEREWIACMAHPQLGRICEVALMRIEKEITERSLNGALDTTFSKDYLKKDIPGWKQMAAAIAGKSQGPLSGATINGPVKIEISIERNPRNDKDEKILADAEREQLEEIGLTEKPLCLGLHQDSTMKKE